MPEIQLWGWSTSPLTIPFWGWEGAASLPVAVDALSMKGAHFHRSNLMVETRQEVFNRKGRLATELKTYDGTMAFQEKINRFYNKGSDKL